MLLSDLGHHIQLTKVDDKKNEKMLFPINTKDDVLIDEEGNTLSEYIPTIAESEEDETVGSPMTAIQDSEIEITDELLALLKA